MASNVKNPFFKRLEGKFKHENKILLIRLSRKLNFHEELAMLDEYISNDLLKRVVASINRVEAVDVSIGNFFDYSSIVRVCESSQLSEMGIYDSDRKKEYIVIEPPGMDHYFDIIFGKARTSNMRDLGRAISLQTYLSGLLNTECLSRLLDPYYKQSIYDDISVRKELCQTVDINRRANKFGKVSYITVKRIGETPLPEGTKTYDVEFTPIWRIYERPKFSVDFGPPEDNGESVREIIHNLRSDKAKFVVLVTALYLRECYCINNAGFLASESIKKIMFRATPFMRIPMAYAILTFIHRELQIDISLKRNDPCVMNYETVKNLPFWPTDNNNPECNPYNVVPIQKQYNGSTYGFLKCDPIVEYYGHGLTHWEGFMHRHNIFISGETGVVNIHSVFNFKDNNMAIVGGALSVCAMKRTPLMYTVRAKFCDFRRLFNKYYRYEMTNIVTPEANISDLIVTINKLLEAIRKLGNGEVNIQYTPKVVMLISKSTARNGFGNSDSIKDEELKFIIERKISKVVTDKLISSYKNTSTFKEITSKYSLGEIETFFFVTDDTLPNSKNHFTISLDNNENNKIQILETPRFTITAPFIRTMQVTRINEDNIMGYASTRSVAPERIIYDSNDVYFAPSALSTVMTLMANYVKPYDPTEDLYYTVLLWSSRGYGFDLSYAELDNMKQYISGDKKISSALTKLNTVELTNNLEITSNFYKSQNSDSTEHPNQEPLDNARRVLSVLSEYIRKGHRIKLKNNELVDMGAVTYIGEIARPQAWMTINACKKYINYEDEN